VPSRIQLGGSPRPARLTPARTARSRRSRLGSVVGPRLGARVSLRMSGPVIQRIPGSRRRAAGSRPRAGPRDEVAEVAAVGRCELARASLSSLGEPCEDRSSAPARRRGPRERRRRPRRCPRPRGLTRRSSSPTPPVCRRRRERRSAATGSRRGRRERADPASARAGGCHETSEASDRFELDHLPIGQLGHGADRRPTVCGARSEGPRHDPRQTARRDRRRRPSR